MAFEYLSQLLEGQLGELGAASKAPHILICLFVLKKRILTRFTSPPVLASMETKCTKLGKELVTLPPTNVLHYELLLCLLHFQRLTAFLWLGKSVD